MVYPEERGGYVGPGAVSPRDQTMETSMVERMFQDDMKWNIDSLDDMCEKDNVDLVRSIGDYSYFDENTWEPEDNVGEEALHEWRLKAAAKGQKLRAPKERSSAPLRKMMEAHQKMKKANLWK